VGCRRRRQDVVANEVAHQMVISTVVGPESEFTAVI